MSEDTSIKSKSPPYLSFTTLRNFLDAMKEGVIPSRIDKSMMVGQSGSTQSYLLSALRFFDLIAEDGTPKPELDAFVQSSGADRQKIWRKIFEPAYAPIIGNLDLERATVGQLHEKFAPFGLNGDTLRKCDSFFAAGAEAAGITISPHLKASPRGATGGPRKSRKPRAAAPADKNTGDDDQDHEPELPALEGHNRAELPLSKDGTRLVKLEAPATVTSAELKRIQAWLSFQLIVEDEE